MYYIGLGTWSTKKQFAKGYIKKIKMDFKKYPQNLM
jgi:hypothetical protein